MWSRACSWCSCLQQVLTVMSKLHCYKLLIVFTALFFPGHVGNEPGKRSFVLTFCFMLMQVLYMYVFSLFDLVIPTSEKKICQLCHNKATLLLAFVHKPTNSTNSKKKKTHKTWWRIKSSLHRNITACSLHSSQVFKKKKKNPVQRLLKKPSCDPLIPCKHRPIISKDHFLSKHVLQKVIS